MIPWPNQPSVYRHVIRIIDDIVPWEGGFVAGATEWWGQFGWTAFYRSDDAIKWRTVDPAAMPLWAALDDGEPNGVWRPERTYVLSLGDQLLAFARGVREPDPGTDDSHQLVIGPWVSSDGQTWSLLETSDLSEVSKGMYIRATAGGQDGVVIIGTANGGSDPVILRSPDGQTWSATTVPAAGQGIELYDVAAFEDGFVIGGRVVDSGIPTPAAWFSSDGSTWIRADVESRPVVSGWIGGDAAGLTEVVVGADGLWALGLAQGVDEPGATPHISWVSRDGRSWRLADPSLPIPAYPVVASDGNRMVMLASGAGAGIDWCSASTSDPELSAWVSTDGANWTSMALTGNDEVFPECEWGPTERQEINVRLDDSPVWVADDRVIVGRRGVGEAHRDQVLWIGSAVVR